LDSVSLILGILSIFLWPIPYAGFPVSIASLVLGIIVLRRGKSRLAVAGIVLSSIGFVTTIIDLKIGILDIILKTYFQY
jgi:hypothetical protein